jgi:acyl carrier protein
MQRQEAFEKVVEIIRPFVSRKAGLEGPTEKTRILQDLNVNSARLVDIILAFEDEFKIAIDDSAADRVQTIGDAVDVILEKSGKGAAA